MNFNYDLTASEEKELRTFETQSLLELTMKKDVLIQAGIIANNIHKESYGDFLAATIDQIHSRVNQMIRIANDELVKRKYNEI